MFQNYGFLMIYQHQNIQVSATFAAVFLTKNKFHVSNNSWNDGF
ncbi:hypothetical protein NIASO_18045 [Niabella soli DSM 19437]|uniref:Uncharacterized protein n=1 Tax=Niabella soli DSM 19437 TaxID=929713 RepID=W0F928_9BACT|nr:hypothetical protein NIASO_18045 [Niabella soli DSM 19437]